MIVNIEENDFWFLQKLNEEMNSRNRTDISTNIAREAIIVKITINSVLEYENKAIN